MRELLEKHWAAFAAQDWAAYKADLADGFEYDETPTGRHGNADDYIGVLKGWKAAFPDAKATFKNIYEAGNHVIGEVEWSGTHKGTLDAPFGTMPASNKPFRVRGVLIYEIKDGKLASSCSYFDLLGLMKQLGAGAALGTPAAKAEAEKRVVA
jgi:steroid delta-isomerase-like uncharacterized protein